MRINLGRDVRRDLVGPAWRADWVALEWNPSRATSDSWTEFHLDAWRNGVLNRCMVLRLMKEYAFFRMISVTEKIRHYVKPIWTRSF